MKRQYIIHQRKGSPETRATSLAAQTKPRPTPGPWKADKWATGWTVSAPDAHYSVCHLEDCNNAKANAALIAAAPDLLAACNAALDGLYSYRDIDGNCSAKAEKDKLMNAIARAEGKEAAL